MRYSIYPIVCGGYHVGDSVDNKESTTVPFADSDNASGWETTTYRKFSMDGKRVIWLCPKCAKRWNEEKQELIKNILEMAKRIEYQSRFLSLYHELLTLGATEEQKLEFDKNMVEAKVGIE